MTPAKSLRPIVWTMTPQVDLSGNAIFPWSDASWQVENRLLPISSSTSLCSEGSATFRLLRRSLIQDGASEYTDQVSSFRVGCYVLITTGSNTTGPATTPTETPDLATQKWFGVITETNFETAGFYDYIGTVNAREVGAAILDNLRIRGFSQDVTGAYPAIMTSCPVANIKANSSSNLIGNAKKGTNYSSQPAYIFSREVSDLGSDTRVDFQKYWTPWRLATHMVQFCVPSGLPPLWLDYERGRPVPPAVDIPTDPAAYIFPGGVPATGQPKTLIHWVDDPSKATSWDLDGLTWKGALDLLFSVGTGLGWRLDLALSGTTVYWHITIVSRSAASSQFGPPKSKSISYTINNDKTAEVSYAEDDSSVYDEVIVQGDNILFGVSVSNLDGNLDRAWNAQQETDYGAAVGIERAQGKFENVFSSFVLKRATAGNGLLRSISGGTGSATFPLTPSVTWDVSTNKANIELALNTDQYLPTLRLSSDVPFLQGIGFDGNKTSNVITDKTPQYLKPQVYYYDSSASTIRWKDMLTRVSTASVTPYSESPQVDIPSNRPAITVKYSRPHTLGLGTFVSTDTGGQDPVFDWRKLVCTVGIWSDQRLEVRRKRPYNNGSVTTVRRQMIVRDDSFKFHATLTGTVVGLASNNYTARTTTTDTIVVDDYAAAQSYCDELAEWACRPRVSANIVTVNDGSTSVYLPGDSLHQVVDNGVGRIIDGLIAVIATDWSAQRVTIQTELPPQPTRGTGSPSPSRGGSVSAELGGTIAQVVQRNQGEQSRLAADLAARPLIPMMGGGTNVLSYMYTVIGGSTIPTLGVVGIPRSATTIVPSTLPDGPAGTGVVIVPAFPVPTGLPAGIGVVGRFEVGTATPTYFFCRVDAGYSGAYGSNDLIAGEGVFLGTTSFLDKVSGGTTWRYVCLSGILGYS